MAITERTLRERGAEEKSHSLKKISEFRIQLDTKPKQLIPHVLQLITLPLDQSFFPFYA